MYKIKESILGVIVSIYTRHGNYIRLGDFIQIQIGYDKYSWVKIVNIRDVTNGNFVITMEGNQLRLFQSTILSKNVDHRSRYSSKNVTFTEDFILKYYAGNKNIEEDYQIF